jgi:hypothetical protein
MPRMMRYLATARADTSASAAMKGGAAAEAELDRVAGTQLECAARPYRYAAVWRGSVSAVHTSPGSART